MEWDKIWSLNKRIIDPIVPRFTALAKEGLVRIHAVGGLDSDKKTLATEMKPYVSAKAKHKKNPDLGTKDTVYSKEMYLEAVDAKECSVDEEVTFMDWGNVIIKSITKDAAGTITDMDVELNLEGDFKKTKKKLTWLSALPPPVTPKSNAGELIPVELMDYDFLITKKKLEEEDDFTDFVTPVSEFKVKKVSQFFKKIVLKFSKYTLTHSLSSVYGYR